MGSEVKGRIVSSKKMKVLKSNGEKQGSKVKKNSSAAAAHPKTYDMVLSAVTTLKERKGSSLQAIKKFISAQYKIDSSKIAVYIRRALRKAVDDGSLIQTKGTGATGSFKLPPPPTTSSSSSSSSLVRKKSPPASPKRKMKSPPSGTTEGETVNTNNKNKGEKTNKKKKKNTVPKVSNDKTLGKKTKKITKKKKDESKSPKPKKAPSKPKAKKATKD